MPTTVIRHSYWGRVRNWVPTWSALNRLGKSRVLRSSYFWLVFVPLSAKLLARVGNEVSLTLFGEIFLLTMGLPFSWKAFFYASVAFSVASLAYALSCPTIVRDYERFSDLTDQGKGGRQIVDAFQRYLWPKMDRSRVQQFLETFARSEKIDPTTNIYVEVPISTVSPDVETRLALAGSEILPEKLQDAFWYVRDLSDRKSVTARCLCTVLYSVGFIFLAVVFAQNIAYVLAYG